MFKKSTFPGFSCYQQWTSSLYRSFFCFCFTCAFDKAAAFIFHIHPNNNLGNVRAKSSSPWPNLPRRTFNRYIYISKNYPTRESNRLHAASVLFPSKDLRSCVVLEYSNYQRTRGARGGNPKGYASANSGNVACFMNVVGYALRKKAILTHVFSFFNYKRF